MTKTLGEALPEEMARVRDEVLPAYIEIGPAGSIAATLMRRDLDIATRAIMNGDVVAMMAIYKELKGWQV